MRRILTALAAISVLALAASAAASSSHRATIKLRHTSRGALLVNSRGFTLYMYTRDRTRKDACVHVSGCTGVWPLVKTQGKPIAGSGVKASLLGTITLSHGVEQVTYAGHPLYTYVADSGPGATSYIGINQFGGRWYALKASGALVK